MDSKPKDITPKERDFLRSIRSRPGMYTGHRGTISDFELFVNGRSMTLLEYGLSEVRIIPTDFTEYLAEKYDISASVNWASIIRSISTDEYTAFDKFWELLNEYLELNGYEPIEELKANIIEHEHKDGIAEMFYYDIPKAAESYMKTFNSEPWNDTWNMKTAKLRIRELFYSSRHYRRCVWKDNRIIGGLMGRFETYFDGDVFQLVELWIEPEFQGKGYAKQLLESMKSDFRKWHDIKRVYLLTMHGDSTEEFYRHNGFETDNGMCVMNLDL